jgi:hypothetical protein
MTRLRLKYVHRYMTGGRLYHYFRHGGRERPPAR